LRQAKHSSCDGLKPVPGGSTSDTNTSNWTFKITFLKLFFFSCYFVNLERWEYDRRDPSHWPCDTKLALTSPTSGGHSVGIVRSLTKAMELLS
jgi:hypothetical protein